MTFCFLVLLLVIERGKEKHDDGVSRAEGQADDVEGKEAMGGKRVRTAYLMAQDGD